MTHSTEAILKSSPSAQKRTSDLSKFTACVEACFDCALSCTVCADSCISEQHVDALKQCIRLNEDCAALCLATGRVMSRLGQGVTSAVSRQLVATCAAACAECATECEKHAKMHEHCKVCAEACRRCEAACKALSAH